MKYNVNLRDINGNLLYTFENVEPQVTAGTVTISDGKFIKNDIITLNCVVDNAIEGDETNVT